MHNFTTKDLEATMRTVRCPVPKPIITPVIFTTLAFLLLAGCGDTGVGSMEPEDSFPSSSFPEGTTGNTVHIDAATGGVVDLPVQAGSVSLSIPPGALPSSMAISVSTPLEATPGRLRLALEPAGLEFLEPVRVTVSLPQVPDTDFALVTIFQVSELCRKRIFGGPTLVFPSHARARDCGTAIV